MNHGKVKMVALAGAEEIGMNMTVYSHEDVNGYKYNILVDCGVSFDNLPGANTVMPDIKMLKDLDLHINEIVLTHGHEDHIGALTYLFDHIKAPMYATPFTASLIRKKFESSKIKNYQLETIQFNEERKFGPFNIKWISVTHSIPDSSMLCIEVDNTRILHTGDWKVDMNPVVGRLTDFEAIAEFAKKGIDVLVSDSTNIHEEETAVSEGDVYASLQKLVANTTTGKFVLTCFASNVARVKSCLDAARNAGRKVLVLGGSLKRTIEAATELGYIEDDIIITEEEAAELPSNMLMIISTGSQAEENSALWKMTHKMRSVGSVLEKGDTLVFSARVIDGRQHDVRKIINKLVERGVRILHPWNSQDSLIHASGHPARPDIKKLLETAKPRCVIPVHCEAEHRVSHIAFAKELGFKTYNIRNGILVEIKKEKNEVIIEKEASVEHSRLVYDGSRLLHETSGVLKTRKTLNEGGIVCVSVFFKNKKISAIVTNHGVFDKLVDVNKKGTSFNFQLKYDIERTISAYTYADMAHQKPQIKEKVIDAAKKSVWDLVKKVPLISVHFAV